MAGMLSIDEFKEALPPQMRKSINKELVDSINATLTDPELLAVYRENLLSYTSVLKEGKFKLENYLNAVRYVGFKVMGMSNKDAYIKTFPGKYQGFLQKGYEEKDIASYITAYNKSKLVNLIFEQTLIPVHILNAPLYQQAINTQAALMIHSKSDKVRCDAANSLLIHLKPPETRKIELDIGVKEDGAIAALRVHMAELVEQQKALIAAGLTAQEIAHQPIMIEATLEEVGE